MTLPLATLRRFATRVLLRSSFAGENGLSEPGRQTTRVDFRSALDAAAYLRFWHGDAVAMADLRNALSRHSRAPTERLSNEEVIQRLAVHLVCREMVAVADVGSFTPSLAGVVLPRSPAPSAAAFLGSALTPPAPPPPPLLPMLEQVRIEGARVLPEVIQTLEQLDLTMARIGIATLSLEPTPSGVPPIAAALQEAGGSISATLDDL